MYKIPQHTLVGVLLLLFACQISAATVVKLNVEVTNKDETKLDANIISVDGDRIRVDYLGSEKVRTNETPFLLTLDAGKSWLVGNQGGDKFYCAKVNMDDLLRDIGDIIARIDSFANAEFSNDKVVLLSEEPGQKLHGYKTTHAKIQTTANVKASILYKKYEYSLKKTDDIWYAKGQKVHPAKQRWVQAITRSGYGRLDKLSGAYRSMINGVILKHESVTKLTDHKKNTTDTYIRKLEVVSIQEQDASRLPAGTFTKPKCDNINKEQMKNIITTVFKENKLTL